MPQVSFTPTLARHIETASIVASGDTVGAALESIFRQQSRLRGYVLDDQSRLRRHIAIFVNGALIARDVALNTRVAPQDEVLVMQALSGG